jgi:phosphonoacetaldehyde hydrolase
MGASHVNDRLATRRRVKAVILDWAGTTIDFGSRAPTSVFLEIFRARGVEITSAEARGPMGRAKHDHIAAVLAMPRVRERWTQVHGHPPGQSEADAMYAEFLPLQKRTLADHARLIPGVVEAIAACRARGLGIGSTTGYTRALVDVVCPLAARQGYVPDVVIAADDVAAGRPAPWMNYRAAERLGVYPMDSIVTIDDTPAGIEAGRNAGMWTVGVTRTGNEVGLSAEELAALSPAERATVIATARAKLLDAGAHAVIESVAELPELLDEIKGRMIAQLSS